MSPDAFAAHPLWNRLDTIQSQLDAAEQTAPPADVTAVSEIRRILAATRAYRQVHADSDLVAEAMLSRLDSPWAQVEGYLSNSISSPTSYQSHVDAARGFLDPIRDELARLPRPVINDDGAMLITERLNDYVRQIEESRNALADLNSRLIEEADQRTAIHRHEVESLSGRIEELTREVQAAESRLASSEGRLDQALTSNNDAFNSAQTGREQEFATWLRSQGDAFEQLADPHLTGVRDAKTASEDALAQVNRLRTSVVDVSNLAAGDILSKDYGASATKELKLAYVGYLVGGVIALAGIAAVFIAFGGIEGEIDPTHAALKLALGAGAAGIATVAFRFGGQAMRRSTSFKRQELELRALAPFLEGVEKGTAEKVRTSFIDRSFGRAFASEKEVRSSEPEAVQLETITKLAQTALDRIPKPS